MASPFHGCENIENCQYLKGNVAFIQRGYFNKFLTKIRTRQLVFKAPLCIYIAVCGFVM